MTETEVSMAETEVSVAETEVSMAETEVSMTETEVSMTETEVSVAETEVSMTETEVSVAETEISMAETEVSVAETEVSGFKPVKNYALREQKGNSSRQMKKYGRVALRKSITITVEIVFQNIKLNPLFCEALNRSISKERDFFNCPAINAKKGRLLFSSCDWRKARIYPSLSSLKILVGKR